MLTDRPRTFWADEVAIMAVILAVVIVFHHIHKHTEYDFPDRAFQISDVSNHETWVVASLTFALGLHVSQYTYFTDQNIAHQPAAHIEP